MGLGQVRYVNVITDASAVRRGIVSAENLAVRLLAKSDFEHVRNQVGFRPVMLAETFAGSSRVEITKRNEVQSLQLLIPMQHLLEHQLGFAVWIDRPLRQIFRHRHAIGWSISRAR